MKELMLAEIKQRLRGRKWWVLLALWLIVLFLIVLGVWAAANQQARFEENFQGDAFPVGPVMFGTLALFILGLMSLVLPALTATAINGERDRGTLAILQTTMLRPWDIALAKFLSGFVTALAFLVVTLPLAAWALAEGDVPGPRVFVVYIVLATAAALYLAVGLAASALIRRLSLSVLASYVAVFALTVGLPIVFGISMLTADRETIECAYPDETEIPAEFRGDTFTTSRTIVGWRWILLAPDPFVVLADAAPRQSGRFINDPLSAIREGARAARAEGERQHDCDQMLGLAVLDHPQDPSKEPSPVWPIGLAIDAGVFAAAGIIVRRKLEVPVRRLGTGERVA